MKTKNVQHVNLSYSFYKGITNREKIFDLRKIPDIILDHISCLINKYFNQNKYAKKTHCIFWIIFFITLLTCISLSIFISVYFAFSGIILILFYFWLFYCIRSIITKKIIKNFSEEYESILKNYSNIFIFYSQENCFCFKQISGIKIAVDESHIDFINLELCKLKSIETQEHIINEDLLYHQASVLNPASLLRYNRNCISIKDPISLPDPKDDSKGYSINHMNKFSEGYFNENENYRIVHGMAQKSIKKTV